MTKYEFQAVPCPQRAQHHTDQTDGSDPFTQTLTKAINELAAEGWDYIRTETIEVNTRRFGILRKEDRTYLVFRREARAASDPRPIVNLARDNEKVRARRVSKAPVIEFVRSTSRKAASDIPANSDRANPIQMVTAAE